MIQGDGPDRKYRHRNKHLLYSNPDEVIQNHRAEIFKMVDHLLDLMDETDPETNPDAAGKDNKAARALSEMSIIAEYLTGWAMDHVIGLAMDGCSPVPSLPVGFEPSPEYLAAFDSANSHEHEERASLHFRERSGESELDGETQQLIVRNLLQCRTPALPYALRNELADALAAAAHGETHYFLAVPSIGIGSSRYSKRRLQMKAVEHAEFRHAAGDPMGVAQELVANQYGVPLGTLQGWKKELQGFFEPLDVARHLAYAVNGGRALKAARMRMDKERVDLHSKRFSDDVLAEDARQFKARKS